LRSPIDAPPKFRILGHSHQPMWFVTVVNLSYILCHHFFLLILESMLASDLFKVKFDILFLKIWNQCTAKPSMLTSVSNLRIHLDLLYLEEFLLAMNPPLLGGCPWNQPSWRFLAHDWHPSTKYMKLSITILLYICFLPADSWLLTGCSLSSSISRLSPCFFMLLSDSCQKKFYTVHILPYFCNVCRP